MIDKLFPIFLRLSRTNGKVLVTCVTPLKPDRHLIASERSIRVSPLASLRRHGMRRARFTAARFIGKGNPVLSPLRFDEAAIQVRGFDRFA